MPKIQVLDQHTINKIAAGEVIERPSAVVKELVENAIDANANAITVEIKSGGIDFIRVTDNGTGIIEEDIPFMFLRHSTSKIKSAQDLLTVSSLGFRGEALSSIAAVSQVELVTKTQDSLTGIRYQTAGENEGKMEHIGCPNGTTFIIRNLFFNTPARRKFLKSPVTEAGYISELLNRLSSSHPNISFKFINNNQVRLHTSGNGNLKDIIYNIYGRDVASNLIPIDIKEEGITIEGFIAKPKISRGNRNYENYYLNGRYIKSNIITKAIEDAYKPYTMLHRYPFTSLHLHMNTELVDVNVHPTKLEVRFESGNKVYEVVYNSIKNALHKREHINQIELTKKEKSSQPKFENIPEPFEEKRRKEKIQNGNTYDKKEEGFFSSGFKSNKKDLNHTYLGNTSTIEGFPYKAKENFEKEMDEEVSRTEIGKVKEVVEDPSKFLKAEKIEQISFLSEEAKKDHRIIGQVFSTYWFIEYEEKLYIIDQHAAHEKVLYEKTMEALKNKNINSQLLNPPIIISFSIREQEVLDKFWDDFKELGFEIEEFGGNEYAIRGIPSDLNGLAQRDIFIELIDNLTEEIYNQTPDTLLEKIASTSCKAAVKGNQKLSASEVSVLIDSLLNLENPYFCPHGRPTMISLSKYELEKKFKRVL